ncbi:malate:quinone oxidoreductase [Parafrigoribacterium humi]|uniref:malate:quinone oxidoreductase n=1 Tax=Parafrigoribacterium humi TaxID=3144664 RepID=UPI0032EF018B
MSPSATPIDVALIGGGIMSATLGAFLKQLQPDWSIEIFETLSDVAQESSNPWNNAGTGHSALCELNYTPELPDGTIDISKAVAVNEQFQVSRQFWSYLVGRDLLPDPQAFLHPVPHMSFVTGDANVRYLRKRFEALKGNPLFAGMEYSEDPEVIRSWVPAMIPGRKKSQRFAATRIPAGTDVNFGALTHGLLNYLTGSGARLYTEQRVLNISREGELWKLRVKHEIGMARHTVRARFVFVGAGGGALHLLQKSGIPEARGFGGFPVSGEFLRTDNPDVVARHHAKVYGKAAVGSPPMSVPHLDTRVVDGQASLMFGPYAGFSPKFLKSGTWFDLFATIRLHNIIPMIVAGASNLSLVRYLIGQLAARKSTKFKELLAFMPNADPKDWYRITAGQRVQVIKKDPKKGGVLQFGTEVVSSADGSIAGLLGASPGASTAVPIMLDVLKRCFPDRIEGWRPQLETMIPSYGKQLAPEPKFAQKTIAATRKALNLD